MRNPTCVCFDCSYSLPVLRFQELDAYDPFFPNQEWLVGEFGGDALEPLDCSSGFDDLEVGVCETVPCLAAAGAASKPIPFRWSSPVTGFADDTKAERRGTTPTRAHASKESASAGATSAVVDVEALLPTLLSLPPVYDRVRAGFLRSIAAETRTQTGVALAYALDRSVVIVVGSYADFVQTLKAASCAASTRRLSWALSDNSRRVHPVKPRRPCITGWNL